MWKLKYDAPKGFISKKGIYCISVRPTSDKQDNMWYVQDAGIFMPYDEAVSNYPSSVICSSSRNLFSVKAFQRYLRKHGDNLKGYEVILASRYYVKLEEENISLDVVATWEETL